MSLIVQKYGGSSVADADSIKRVARRVVETMEAGNRVAVVVSAMGDTTDELIDRASGIDPDPPARELDMLMTAGERISMSLLAMAIHSLGHRASSFTGQQAGFLTDARYGAAHIVHGLFSQTFPHISQNCTFCLMAVIDSARPCASSWLTDSR